MPVAYECRLCGAQKVEPWLGACSNCKRRCNWRRVNADIPGAVATESVEGEVVSLSDVRAVDVVRMESEIEEFDYVLGGGIVPGGIYLLCGEPGAGKTTLLLQVFNELAMRKYDVLYVTGEQTLAEVKQSMKRIGKISSRLMVMRESGLSTITDKCDDFKSQVVAIDSAQTLYVGDALEIGSASSIKVAIREITWYAKRERTSFFIIGHITKGGAIGGPKALEHYVDCSLFFSGSKTSTERALRCDSKNRYGSTPRSSKFMMTEQGLVGEAGGAVG